MSTTPSADAPPPNDSSINDPLTVPTCCGRRTVLRAAGLVVLAGGAVALSACSADSSATEPTTESSSAEPSESGSSSAEPSGSESSSATSGSGSTPEGTAVPISEVTVGGGVVVEQKYVVTQPTEGEFKAFSAICTHQGCPVGAVEDGAIICPCHNSHFDIATGDPVSGPAQQPLPAVAFTKSGDNIVLTA